MNSAPRNLSRHKVDPYSAGRPKFHEAERSAPSRRGTGILFPPKATQRKRTPFPGTDACTRETTPAAGHGHSLLPPQGANNSSHGWSAAEPMAKNPMHHGPEGVEHCVRHGARFQVTPGNAIVFEAALRKGGAKCNFACRNVPKFNLGTRRRMHLATTRPCAVLGPPLKGAGPKGRGMLSPFSATQGLTPPAASRHPPQWGIYDGVYAGGLRLNSPSFTRKRGP